VYRPHVSALYVRRSALAALMSLAHHFLQVSDKAYKLEPGDPGHELVYGASAVLLYLLFIMPSHSLDAIFVAIAAHEQTLLEPLLQWLGSKHDGGVRIVGQGGGMDRVPTVSFVVVGPWAIWSRDVVKVFDQKVVYVCLPGDIGC
jgi:selenocysteine lyase/cysteine desulfurase